MPSKEKTELTKNNFENIIGGNLRVPPTTKNNYFRLKKRDIVFKSLVDDNQEYSINGYDFDYYYDSGNPYVHYDGYSKINCRLSIYETDFITFKGILFLDYIQEISKKHNFDISEKSYKIKKITPRLFLNCYGDLAKRYPLEDYEGYDDFILKLIKYKKENGVPTPVKEQIFLHNTIVYSSKLRKEKKGNYLVNIEVDDIF